MVFLGAIVAVFLESLLLGSIPWGVVIARVFYKTDLRVVGSGNIGTTNAIRAMGKKGGYAVFVLDFLKGLTSGLLAIVLGHVLGVEAAQIQILKALSFLCCIVGHMYTPWLKGKGGKGIAVGVGCMFVALGPLVAVAELFLFTVLVVITKRISVGSIASAATVPLFALWPFWGNVISWLLCSIAGMLSVWAHRENIARIKAGTEPRIGKNE